MPSPSGPAISGKPREPISTYLERVRGDLIAAGPRISYHVGAPQFNEDDVREYITEPIAALPPSISTLLPPIIVLLVPFLERVNGVNGKENGKSHAKPGQALGQDPVQVAYTQPADGRWVPFVSLALNGAAVLAIAVEGQETADYHYHLYHELAHLAASKLSYDELGGYAALVAEEIRGGAHGEVDDASWTMKQAVRRRGSATKPSKAFTNYARASFIDTLTLYLHGICCDIDVEPGPRQLPSRHLRKRLKLMQEMLPAPKGYAVFPEELDGVDIREPKALEA